MVCILFIFVLDESMMWWLIKFIKKKKIQRNKRGSYLIKEDLSLAEDVFELRQLKEVPFQGFGVLIDLF